MTGKERSNPSPDGAMFKNIILTGFMGTGKTSIGNRLAEITGYRFVDIDGLIEAEQEMSINDIFSQKGEPYFRDCESRIIRRVLEDEGLIVSTGGGAVIREENRAAFKKAGLTICLTARPEVIYERVKHETHRPLLKVPDPMSKIRALLAEREKFYRQADIIIDTSDKSVEEVLNEIKERVRYACC